ncbi:2'-5' RNA ligase family protein [Zhihengliuella alba]|uniref:2'-5' RNA ligase family protein n=1 Tax=Zhihengliuella alba TaxID=547018 RepID=A0ABP7DBA8_9MICC
MADSQHGDGPRFPAAPAKPTAPEGATLGIVISLPEPAAERLRRVRAAYGRPESAVEAPHITLVTGGPTADWDSARDHVAAVAARTPRFAVRLRGTGSFRPVTDVVFVRVVEGWDACRELHDALCAGPLVHGTGYDYHPHVTVAHDAPEEGLQRAFAELADFEAEFAVDRIDLFGIDDDGRWALSEELRLGTHTGTETGPRRDAGLGEAGPS